MIAKSLFIAAVVASSTLVADEGDKESKLQKIHQQADALMKQQEAKEAAALLETAVELDPDDTKALGKLGMIYTLMLNQPEDAKEHLEHGWGLGDIKCLQALGIAIMSTNDHKKLKAYEKDFIDNFKNLSGTNVICFFIAAQNRDGQLFNRLLQDVTEEEIKSSESLARMIATTAKALAAAE